jgi:tetratricopeptide (TPR) repeat protein
MLRLRSLVASSAGILVAGCSAGGWYVRHGQAEIALSQGRLCDAEESYLAALRDSEAFPTPDERTGRTLLALGRLYLLVKRPDVAEPALRQAATHESDSTSDRNRASTLYSLGESIRLQRRAAEAESFHKKALSIRQAFRPDSSTSREVAQSLMALGAIDYAFGRFEAAEGRYLAAMQSLRAAASESELAPLRASLGQAVLAQKRYAEAIGYLESAIRAWDAAYGRFQGKAADTRPREFPRTLELWATALTESGQPEAATPLRERARQVRAHQAEADRKLVAEFKRSGMKLPPNCGKLSPFAPRGEMA